jgi:hypothetical protein
LKELYSFSSAVVGNITLHAKWAEEIGDGDAPGGPLATPSPAPAPAPTPTPGLSFSDVKASDWFFGDVKFVFEKALMLGTSQELFSPDTAITRGMAVTVLYRFEGARGDSLGGSSSISNDDPPGDASGAAPGALFGAANPFSDVADTEYYAEPVDWAAQNGIVLGYPDGTFRPGDIITRQDLSVILHRYATSYAGMELPEALMNSDFADAASIAGYAFGAVDALYMSGIVNGKPGGQFDPEGTATRAEFAALMRRYASLAANMQYG